MNKEIKIIELINKSLKNEEMPLLIKYLGLEYSYAKYKNDYILLFADEEIYFFRDTVSCALTSNLKVLNNKVEILNDFNENKILKDIINKAKEILVKEYKEDVFENYQYDLYKAINTLRKLLEILDNKGE